LKRNIRVHRGDTSWNDSGFYKASQKLYDISGEHSKILLNTKHETSVKLEFLADSSFFGCIFFIFEALIPL
jgi:hypothetical protein